MKYCEKHKVLFLFGCNDCLKEYLFYCPRKNTTITIMPINLWKDSFFKKMYIVRLTENIKILYEPIDPEWLGFYYVGEL